MDDLAEINKTAKRSYGIAFSGKPSGDGLPARIKIKASEQRARKRDFSMSAAGRGASWTS
jgi:hypothetical protein